MAEEIFAPMSGTIIKINIGVGEKVKEDDVIITLEAMKMETEVYSPCDGTIKSISVAVGGSVEEDDILGIIDE